MTSKANNRLLQIIMLCAVGMASARAETVTYFATDHLGSPVAAIDSSGSVIWRESYSPYGEKLEGPSGADNDTGYTGHQFDAATDLTYMQARYYDSVVGRFISVDPVGFKPGNAMSFNRYMYANDNPYTYIDPDGRYGRREGEFSDSEWEKIDASQQATADIFEQGARSIREEGNAKMLPVAEALEAAVTALRDDGSQGYWANSGELPENTFAEINEIGGRELTIDTSKLSFGPDGGPMTPAGKTMMGHEALHSAGLKDQSLEGEISGKKAYRFGSRTEQLIYRSMKGTDQALKNPDHIVEIVSPK